MLCQNQLFCGQVTAWYWNMPSLWNWTETSRLQFKQGTERLAAENQGQHTGRPEMQCQTPAALVKQQCLADRSTKQQSDRLRPEGKGHQLGGKRLCTVPWWWLRSGSLTYVSVPFTLHQLQWNPFHWLRSVVGHWPAMMPWLFSFLLTIWHSINHSYLLKTEMHILCVGRVEIQ